MVELWSAQFLRSDAAAPPPASARWRNVELPDRWRDPERYEEGLIGWYRFSLPDGIVSAPDRLPAAYLWRFKMTVEVWFNGVFVARRSGLRNMSERAAQLGGLLELGGAEGEGVVVTLRLALAGRVVPA